MKFIDFEGSNALFGPPAGMTEEDVHTIHALRFTQERNVAGKPVSFAMIAVCIEPSPEDIEAIKAGRPIWVHVMGTSFAPMGIFTTNEQNEVNP